MKQRKVVIDVDSYVYRPRTGPEAEGFCIPVVLKRFINSARFVIDQAKGVMDRRHVKIGQLVSAIKDALEVILRPVKVTFHPCRIKSKIQPAGRYRRVLAKRGDNTTECNDEKKPNKLSQFQQVTYLPVNIFKLAALQIEKVAFKTEAACYSQGMTPP